MDTIATNRQIELASRPTGMPNLSNFAMKEAPIPILKDGEVLVRTLYISVDPYMRGRMREGPSYIEPFELNKPLEGGVVGKIVDSKNPAFKIGDLVLGYLAWADHSISNGKGLHIIDSKLTPISTALGILGMPGMTAYFGMLDIGRPNTGETVVVSGAAGAVGTAAGQIAKIKGCRIIGIAGSDEKTDYLVKELGFDAAINYKKKDYAEQLKEACPKGVDVYFDNVGGDITDHVVRLLNKNARIVLCGQISMYNLDKPDIGPRNWWILLTKSALVKGFIVTDYESRFSEGIAQMAKWIQEGKIKYNENVIDGLENAPNAFLGLFKGENIGKQLVKVANDT